MRLTVRSAIAVVLLAVAGLAGGCSSSSGADPGKLEGSWVLESFGGAKQLTPAAPGVTTTLNLKDGKSSGNGGVNSYSGTYEADAKGSLTFSAQTATLMAGPEPAMQQETKFFSALDKTEHFEINDGKLVLGDLGNNTLAVLKRK